MGQSDGKPSNSGALHTRFSATSISCITENTGDALDFGLYGESVNYTVVLVYGSESLGNTDGPDYTGSGPLLEIEFCEGCAIASHFSGWWWVYLLIVLAGVGICVGSCYACKRTKAYNNFEVTRQLTMRMSKATMRVSQRFSKADMNIHPQGEQAGGNQGWVPDEYDDGPIDYESNPQEVVMQAVPPSY